MMRQVDYEANFRQRCKEIEQCKAEMTACRARLVDVWPDGLSFRKRMWFHWAFFAHRCDMVLWGVYVAGAKWLFGWEPDTE